MACLLVFIFVLLVSSCRCDDQLTQANPLRPGDMLVSKGGVFALGFFSLSSSNKSLYVGIWYNNIPERTYVWVANRNNPTPTNLSGVLAIADNSSLVLSDSKGHALWTTTNNITTKGVSSYAVLLDSGNLVLRLTNGTDIWQSFDHPTDTVLPSMRILLSYKAQDVGQLVAWKGLHDPSTGDFSVSGDPSSNLQIFIWHGTKPYCRIVVVDDVWVSGAAYQSNITSVIYQTFVNTGNGLYFTYTISDGSPYARIKLDYMGSLRLLSWNNKSSSWTLISKRPTSSCELYTSCGPFGSCDFTDVAPTCQCLDGFEPDDANFSRGCRRKEALKCGKKSHFVTISGIAKVPDKFANVRNRSFDECAAECSRNCLCMAYAYANLTNSGTMADQSRCLVWTGELVDTGTASNNGENLYLQNLYLRLADSPVSKKNRHLVKIVLPVIACLLILTCIYLVRKCKSRGKGRDNENQTRPMLRNFSTFHELLEQNLEFPYIKFEDVTAGTNNFSDSSMLGKGGFGKVYKAKLEGGKEVAVKRLSIGSKQGIEHFTNEVVLIAKLQHKNLVRLLGFCTHEDEKLLIYEYLPNKSLDYFLFDDSRKSMLDWQTRLSIIKGVARGLVYLHQDSRMKIIHRDLKPSNILLDEEMSPKISDFGMARIFGGNQHQANTKHVVGTYGYMSPEYAMEGIFSVKSDTYSFGVLVLELISGSKISSPHLAMDFPNLMACAWSLWKDGKAENFVDSFILESYSPNEALLCMHVGLLCVQDDPKARPLMPSVVAMFENEPTTLPTPKQPAYFVQRGHMAEGAREDEDKSVNNMSLTTLQGR